jgi:hypothetical protein
MIQVVTEARNKYKDMGRVKVCPVRGLSRCDPVRMRSRITRVIFESVSRKANLQKMALLTAVRDPNPT